MKLQNCDPIEIEIRAERARQEMKFGPQNHDPFKYLAILGEEVGEANQAAIEAYDWKSKNWKIPYDGDGKASQELHHLREELIQVAAVAKAMIECLERREWADVPMV